MPEDRPDIPGDDEPRPEEQPTEDVPADEPLAEEPTAEAPTTEAPPPPRSGGRFLRSRDERIIGGVAGGLAAVVGVEVWIVRLGFVLTAFFGGAGLIAYLVALAFVPEDRGDGTAADMPPLTPKRITQGVVLVGVGIIGLAVVDVGLGIGWILGPNLLVLGLLGLLAYAAYRGLERNGDGRQPAAARIAGAVLLTGAILAMVAFGAVAAFWLAATGNGTAATIAVITLGAVAVVGAFVRPVRWLAPAALVIAMPVAVVAAADIDIDGGVGERTYRPVQVQEIPVKGYELGMGEMVIDLRELEWPRTGLVELDVDMGIGHAVVLVPHGVCVRAKGDIGIGAISVLDDESGGIDVEQELGDGRPGDSPRLVVNGELGIGHLEIDTQRGRDRDDWFDDEDFDRDGPVLLAPPEAPEAPEPAGSAKPTGDCERS